MHRRRALALAPVAVLAASVLAGWPRLAVADGEPAAGDEAGFALVVRPFLERHCFECHGRGEAEGELRLDAFVDKAAVVRDRERWTTVLERLHAGDMPPEDKPRPSADEVNAVIAWVRGAVGGASAPQGPFKQAKLQRINRFHVEQLAYLLAQLSAVPEGRGTLLDNTLIVFGSAIGDGDRHDHDDLPILLCGRGGGSVQGGRHLRFPQETPLCNLYLSLLQRAGVRATSFGDSRGPLEGL